MKLRLQTGLSGRRSFFGYLKTADKYMKSLIFVIFGLWSRRHIGKIATLTTNCYCNVTNRVLRVPLAGVYPSDVAGLPKAGHAATGLKLGRFVLASTCAGAALARPRVPMAPYGSPHSLSLSAIAPIGQQHSVFVSYLDVLRTLTGIRPAVARMPVFEGAETAPCRGEV
jgi:hypothetical protein